MTFGLPLLLRGFDFLVVVIGLFGISEILVRMEDGLAFKGRSPDTDLTVVLKTRAQLPRYWLTLVRSSIVGCWLGITPGGRHRRYVHRIRSRQEVRARSGPLR